MHFRRFALLCSILLLLSGCSNCAVTNKSKSIVPAYEEKTLFLIFRFTTNFNDSENCDTHYSEKDYLNDTGLQKKAAQIRMEYPLVEDAQITSYAWTIYEILVDQERMGNEYIPYAARSYSDGIWYISFLPEESHGSYYDGVSYSILISAFDGHIIDFCPEQ